MLIRLSAVDLPTPPDRLFGREGPLVLEVGFGDGRFLAMLARAHPEWNLLGVEVSAASVARARKRLLKERVAHARLYLGHARFVVRNLIPPKSLHRVYVNFPDPWPKKRHQHKRLLQAPFFRLLSTRLADGGALLFTTDHEEYFTFALEEAKRTGLYRVEVGPPPPEALKTKYALKWQEQQKPIFHAAFHKAGEDAGAYPPIERYTEMPHALLEGTLPEIERFAKQVHAFEGGHVIVLEAYRDLEGPGLIFLARVEEADLVQEVLVEARPSAKGVFVGLKGFGAPLVTRGVKEAVRWVTAWLEARGLRARQRSY
ncbi:tRNA (guanosine(46)-N7)-methyltransferase TrmB [Marinithermus hydrothermalis]|uniref:tRNA (guanine-N(7)-)-methyltransferase n=1 Tax=Marinithermus hydrothermalis (strain DSM 14884 / JCM 11576 / T1) TaxID=869210 RepID=F2NNH5_MARHT|nr:tRNA (guanosine(46)-N7)-methyltransferase TrmB [Marinithermus hydrothermalis]AEB10785.1 tRNA (guanine-N(7)-)-methyltransferase [Marinithermus hydrothermalis DSM 14884]